MGKEIYCEKCRDFKPLIEEEPKKDDLNEYPWGDLLCGECKLVIATIRIVPSVTTREPLCTRCLKVPADDLCPSCKAALDKIWPGCPEFARELEREDQDEAARLSLGMGE